MNSMKQDTNKPHILIYAHYYHPDVASTGQILKELAEGLLEQFRVTVLCVVPSYKGTVDEAYTKQKYYYEELNGVRIIRVRVPPFDKTSRSSRVKNIVAYFFRAMWATLKVPDVDYVYSISQPPVLGGLLGCYGRIFRHARYIYNIQDFNPEQIIATGYSKSKLLLKALSVLDKHSCKRADKVIIVGRDMVETLEKRFTKKNGKRSRNMPTYAFINNWIDEKEIYPLPLSHPRVDDFRKANGLSDKYVIMYSGNLGLYYDLENILPKLAKFPKGTKTADGREVVFAFVGDGSIKQQLVQIKKNHHMDNVVFIPYQDKADLIYSLNAADAHWCVSAKGIKGVSVPSKLYGAIATAKPILAVLEEGAEARLIVEETGCGLLSTPCEYDAMLANLQVLLNIAGSEEEKAMGERGRDYLVKHLTKDVSIAKYTEEILAIPKR